MWHLTGTALQSGEILIVRHLTGTALQSGEILIVRHLTGTALQSGEMLIVRVYVKHEILPFFSFLNIWSYQIILRSNYKSKSINVYYQKYKFLYKESVIQNYVFTLNVRKIKICIYRLMITNTGYTD